ncbi:RNA polymerase sigma factor [Agromyces sp. NPDC055520]
MSADARSTAGARAAAAHAARVAFGRLVALLASGNGDIASAEDAVASAFEQALISWPDAGVPDNPEGWLLTVARNRQRDVWKSAAHRTGVEAGTEAGEVGRAGAIGQLGPLGPLDDVDVDAIGDRRLELMFACAHPAIDPAVRTPLMLQTVLGFGAAEIAAAYGATPAAFAKRLVRAKRRIRDAGIPFAIPDRASLPGRRNAVLEAVYGCYAIAWHDADGRTHRAPDSMAGEALYLAETLATLLESDAEAWSLAAVISLSLSRAGARAAAFVPLDEQDPGSWDPELIEAGEAHLRRAERLAEQFAEPLGRFRLEAAMQAVHAARLRTGVVDWAALEVLAGALVVVAPTAGAQIALAAVTGRNRGPDAGLALLDGMPAESERLAAFHATRADLLARAGREAAASAAYSRAAALESDPAASAHLLERAGAVGTA